MNVIKIGRKGVMNEITVFRKDIYYPLITSPNVYITSQPPNYFGNDSAPSGLVHVLVQQFMPSDLNNAHLGPKIDYVAY